MIYLRLVLTIGVAVVAVATGPARVAAQADGITVHDLPKSETYEARTRFQRLQSDVYYVDVLDGEIPMDGVPNYTPPERDADGDITIPDGPAETLNRVILAVLAIGAIVAAVIYGPPLLRRLGLLSRETQSLDRRATAGDEKDIDAIIDRTGLLDRLRNMEDAEAALIKLVEALLPVAARQNGLRLARSETAREFLRRLPGGWSHLASLKRIVMTEELVQFGGRPVTRRMLEDCLDRAGPILEGAA